MGYASKVKGSGPAIAVAEAPVSNSTDRVWSGQQCSVFHWFATSKIDTKLYQNLVVVARAGTGKTTTIVEGVNRAPETDIMVCAFNKRIAVELEARVKNPNAQVKTLHGIGFSIIKEFWPRVRVAKGDDRARDLAVRVCGRNVPDTIIKLVAKLHTKAREIQPYANKPFHLEPLAEQFECAPDFFWGAQGYTLQYVLDKACDAMQAARDEADQPKTGIDFADMIFLPIAKGWAIPRASLVVVDEAQDMTLAQLELARKICTPDGRFCVVGDDKQAIYGFRGADSDSLSRLKKELNAGQLGLTVTYRCGKAIVARAQEYAPDFVAGPSNSEGKIETAVRETFLPTVQYGDFVLSRLNAPLAGVAMRLLRDQRRVKIAGRDIGQSLKTLVRKLAKGAQSMEDFFESVEKHRESQMKRLVALKWDAKIAELNDTIETLTYIGEGCNTLAQMENVCDTLFTDDGLGDKGLITLSSVHKAKGLEADNVFILEYTLRYGKSQEEDNIAYVAITRAKHTLTMVQ